MSQIRAALLQRLKAAELDLVIAMGTWAGQNLANSLEALELFHARQIGIKAFAFKPIIKSDFAKIVREVLDNVQQPIQYSHRGERPLS